MDVVELAGVQVDNVTLAEALAKVEQILKGPKPQLVVTPNPEIIVNCQEDGALKQIINTAALRIPDGISMIVVSKLRGTPLKERVTGIDLMQAIVKMSAEKGYKVFLLGSAPGIVEEAAVKLKEQYPELKLVGTQHGYFEQKDETQVIQMIKNSQADLLFAGLGGGRQEKWLAANLDKLGIKAGMAIGGSLDVISGRKQRAPQWIQSLYIEWLYRLFTEPQRWKRQLALPKFLYLTLLNP
jgi:N-acetylglucosaminyldiphosphoundecaprenol N-acetyl-beta-D-mannosaminyltransferase